MPISIILNTGYGAEMREVLNGYHLETYDLAKFNYRFLKKIILTCLVY
jgi:hypothetical protein